MKNYLDPVIQSSRHRTYDEKSIILYQGEAPRSACILISGVVRVFSISDQGGEQVVALHTSGEFFPTAWIFGKTPGTLFFYEALSQCEIAFVSRESLLDFIYSDPSHTRSLIDYFSTNYAAMMIRVNALEQPRAKDKLAHTLFYLSQRYAKTSSHDVTIPINLTHQLIGAMAGITRETTAVEMNKLKSKGIVSYKNQCYTVRTSKLLEFIGEDSFRDIHINE